MIAVDSTWKHTSRDIIYFFLLQIESRSSAGGGWEGRDYQTTGRTRHRSKTTHETAAFAGGLVDEASSRHFFFGGKYFFSTNATTT